MGLYAHVVTIGVPALAALYLVLSFGFAWRNRRAERQVGAWRRAR